MSLAVGPEQHFRRWFQTPFERVVFYVLEHCDILVFVV